MIKQVTPILFGVMFILFACEPTPPSPISSPPPPIQTPVAMLTRVLGEVIVQQIISNQTFIASEGNLLRFGDLIKTGDGAEVEAMCIDGQKIEVSSNQNLEVSCGETPDPIYEDIILHLHDGVQAILDPRGPDIPEILSPRNTKIVNDRPTFHWAEVDKAEAYTVIISNRDGNLWQITIPETTLPYPMDQPPLDPQGGTYTLKIAVGEFIDESQQASGWIDVLSEAEEDQMQEVVGQINALSLAEESRRFLLASYYAEQELNQFAVDELSPLTETSSSPTVFWLLGKIYLATGFLEKAQEHYAEAHRLAQEQNKLWSQADALVGLGQVAKEKNEFTEAEDHYQSALTLYQELGLEDQAAVVTDLIAGVPNSTE